VQDAWWLAVLVVAAVLLLGAVAATASAIARLDVWRAASDLAGGVVAWWFVAGAWLRTSWGRPSDVLCHPPPPVMGARTAAALTAGAALCLAAAGVALFVQLVTAS